MSMRKRVEWLMLVLVAACSSGTSPGSGDQSIGGGGSAAGGSRAGASGSGASTGAATAGATAAVGGRSGSVAAGQAGSAAAGGVGAAGAGTPSTSGGAGASSNTSDDDAGVAGGSAAAAGSGTGAAGNGAGAAGSGATDTGTGPGDWVAGDYPPNLTDATYLEISGVEGQGSNVRQYKVHVPPGYDPNTPTPVVFCLHGLGQDPVLFCVNGADMPAKSDAAGFILVMPFGYQNSWNGGTCCGGAAGEKLDDIALIRAIYAEVGKHVNIDTSRVYATGLSNGGYMSYRLACEASDIFVAVAPGAGAIGMADIGGGTSAESDITACTPTQKVSVLHLHGTEDPLIPFDVQKKSLDRIAEANGCTTMTAPAAKPVSQGDTTCVTYQGCPDGIEVTGCSVEGGGHVWFGNPTCGTGVDAACAIVGANSDDINNTDAAWEFLSAHSR